jgi:hypothetical protein
VRPSRLLEQRVSDVVRLWPSLVLALADLGISPRYAGWTLRAAAADAGVAEERMLARLRPALRALSG